MEESCDLIPAGTRVRVKKLTRKGDQVRYSNTNPDRSAPRWANDLARLAGTEGVVAKSGFGKHLGTDVRFPNGNLWCFFEEDLEILSGPATVGRKHPLIGTWITETEDSDAAFTISVKDGALAVSGFCLSDGERFIISALSWDGERLRFTARMPSTSAVTWNCFSIRPDGKANLELTLHEVWKKKTNSKGIGQNSRRTKRFSRLRHLRSFQ
jgi:hypothetical protein